MRARDRAWWEAYCERRGWEGVVFLDGLDAAIVGVTVGGSEPRLVYDYARIIEVVHARDGGELEDVREYVDVNVCGMYVGEATPVILEVPDELE